jgi:hypothetical protein
MFAIDRSTLPSLRTFIACKTHAERWRAKLTKRANHVWGDACVPLRNTRDQHLRLEWREGSKAWACMLYRTAVVTHYENGNILLNASYNTVSTRTFFEEMTPSGVWLRRTKYGYAYCIGHSDDFEWHQVNRPITREPDVGQGLLIDEQGVVLNPLAWHATKTVADRERRKEIRAKLKPFTDWYTAMTRATSSVMAVIAGVEEKYVPYAKIVSMLESMMHGENDEMQWRYACKAAYPAVSHRVWPHGDEQYGLKLAEPMLNYILDVAFKQFNGYKDVTILVPPGQCP